MSKTILIVAAHTDDEALGCGGAIARHVDEGDIVHAVFMADGVSSRPNTNAADYQQRQACAERAHALLGIEKASYLGLPDNRMDSVALLDIIQHLEGIIHSVAPDVIYTHHHSDLNIDHCITYQSVMTACRPLPNAKVREIYTFEVMSSTEWAASGEQAFHPNYFIDISAYLTTKMRALEAYRHEMRPAPHSRSIEHIEILARHRGHTVGVSAAEAFMVARLVR